MRGWIGLAAAIAVVGALSACGPATVTQPPPPVDQGPAIHQQAVDALARWDAAAAVFTGPVIIAVGGPVGQIGQFEQANASYQRSLDAGLILLDHDDLPAEPDDGAIVSFADGRTATLSTLSARDALGAMPAASDCDGCPGLHITTAELTHGVLATTRGPVTMPLWEYSLTGTAVRITRPAVTLPQPTVTPPPWDSANPPAGLQFYAARGSATGPTLTVFFIGGPATGTCRMDYRPEAFESATAVVVALHQQRAGDPVPCDAMGYGRQATVTLNRPLGERTVLEGRQGTAVPTVLLP